MQDVIGSKESIEHSINTLEIWLIIFACIVAIGVAGEFFLGWISWRKHRELKDIQSSEEQRLNLEIEQSRSKNLALEKEVLVLKTKLQPRSISLEQKSKILERL